MILGRNGLAASCDFSRSRSFFGVFAGAILTVVLAFATGAHAQLPGATVPSYQDNAKPAGERAADLVSRMTLEEKASQLLNDAPAIPRLQIREYNWWNEGLHGVAAAGHATVFPQAIGMAATFDTPQIGAVADLIGVRNGALVFELPARSVAVVKVE